MEVESAIELAQRLPVTPAVNDGDEGPQELAAPAWEEADSHRTNRHQTRQRSKGIEVVWQPDQPDRRRQRQSADEEAIGELRREYDLA